MSAPFVLDIGRSIARFGAGPPTGIDRVERAWIDHVLTLDGDVFALARIRRRTLLLDREGIAKLFSGGEGRARVLDRLRGRADDERAKAEGLAADIAIADWRDIPDARLGALLGSGSRYLSVGHTGLNERCLGAVAAITKSRCGVLLHDTIPLDWPQTQAPQSARRFSEKLEHVARDADVVIAPLQSTSVEVSRHLEPLGWQGTLCVAPLGLTPVSARAPHGLPTDRPLFIVLGTVEPRKNHGFLFELWRDLPEPRPRLVVVGRRGWADPSVFSEMERLVSEGVVVERNDMPDEAVAAAIEDARGLLFPSLAEGFGYPPLEAAALGCPVVAAPLAQTRELLGDSIVYAELNERYQWLSAIADLSVGDRKSIDAAIGLQWNVHFDLVLKSLND